MGEIIPAHFLCASPYKVEDIITMEETLYPEWWQFWKKPIKVLRTYEVKTTIDKP